MSIFTNTHKLQNTHVYINCIYIKLTFLLMSIRTILIYTYTNTLYVQILDIYSCSYLPKRIKKLIKSYRYYTYILTTVLLVLIQLYNTCTTRILIHTPLIYKTNILHTYNTY